MGSQKTKGIKHFAILISSGKAKPSIAACIWHQIVKAMKPHRFHNIGYYSELPFSYRCYWHMGSAKKQKLRGQKKVATKLPPWRTATKNHYQWLLNWNTNKLQKGVSPTPQQLQNMRAQGEHQLFKAFRKFCLKTLFNIINPNAKALPCWIVTMRLLV